MQKNANMRLIIVHAYKVTDYASLSYAKNAVKSLNIFPFFRCKRFTITFIEIWYLDSENNYLITGKLSLKLFKEKDRTDTNT